MGYIHISNFYKDQDILLFKECFALEKIHGTSSRIEWNHETRKITFFGNGEKYINFVRLFDVNHLQKRFESLFPNMNVTIYGETYGADQQNMSETYGPKLKFIVFDMLSGLGLWYTVERAELLCQKLELEFVPYVRIPATVEAINAERDRESIQALRNGMGSGKKREGVVLRPIFECLLNGNKRIICKHKQEAFQETKTARPVKNPDSLEVLTEAQAVADEWVTDMRLTHVLQEFKELPTMKDMKKIVIAMVLDVYREAEGEIVESKAVEKAIAAKTVELFKTRISVPKVE
jgi:hypothetical protein